MKYGSVEKGFDAVVLRIFSRSKDQRVAFNKY